MAYVVRAKGAPGNDKPARFITTRWRSDDPWGAVWRCLYDCMQPLLKWPPGKDAEHVLTVEVTVHFEPDAEDLKTALFPADPLDQHRKDEPHKERKPNHGKIPRE